MLHMYCETLTHKFFSELLQFLEIPYWIIFCYSIISLSNGGIWLGHRVPRSCWNLEENSWLPLEFDQKYIGKYQNNDTLHEEIINFDQ